MPDPKQKIDDFLQSLLDAFAPKPTGNDTEDSSVVSPNIDVYNAALSNTRVKEYMQDMQRYRDLMHSATVTADEVAKERALLSEREYKAISDNSYSLPGP